ncbi:hypothetical protein [Desulfosporosinus sp.]|uniref:hypothetical protein n=1 Tax=Desulfosporosinus sp. TaxID=157907 RepID=UPI0025B8D127|nr:hypothetical protein [Desulfosporosinus sp.]MBC2723325.1 hypothetical protein [Desulfosporosinus sp.]MBC2726237.1 hypothetical protein [Desulfosporosinus sp.]
MRKPSAKILSIVLIGSLLFIPINPKEAHGNMLARIVSKVAYGTTKAAINGFKANKAKNKLPIIAGYKKGRDPLPKGTTPAMVRGKIWESIKRDLGLK